MKCIAHKAEAVAVCAYCGRALCSDCIPSPIAVRMVCSTECAAALARGERAMQMVLQQGVPNARASAFYCYLCGGLSAVAAVVLGNQAGLVQCFSNLLGNAVKFIPPGARPWVRIWTEDHGDRLRIWVEDRGIGIPKDSQERIFGMFQRLHRSEEYPGTGVGLALVRKVIHR